MTTRKKLIISMVTLSVAIVAALGITFGVLAAQNQAVTNQFSVSYTANNVSATVGIKYAVAGGEDVYFSGGNAYYDETNSLGQNSAITFVPTTSESTGNLTTSNAELTSTNSYVIYTYYFKNNASNGGKYLTATITDDLVTTTNMTTKYFPSTRATETYSNINTNGYDSYENIPQKTMYIEPGDTMYFYLLVEISDLTVDASLARNNSGNWALATSETVSEGWTTYTSSMSSVWTDSNQGGGGQQDEPAQIGSLAMEPTAFEVSESANVIQFSPSITQQEIFAIINGGEGVVLAVDNNGDNINVLNYFNENNEDYGIYIGGMDTWEIWGQSRNGWHEGFTHTTNGITYTWDSITLRLTITGADVTYVSSITGANGELFGKPAALTAFAVGEPISE